jgi:uncharacterized protein with PIN domain
MGPVEAAMIADAAMTSAAANVATTARSERPRCPSCAGAVKSYGKRSRVLVTELGERLRMDRSYVRCEQCGLEFFPPR